MLILASLAVAIWLFLLLMHGRFWQAGPVLGADNPLDAPPVAVVVPARDEAPLILPVLHSLLAQTYPGPLRIILVDDGSSDGTGDLARGIGDPRLTVRTGAPRPPGWSGKLWAVHQGVQEAGEVSFVLLTDADIVHDPSHITALVSHALRGRYAMVSEMVQLNCASPAERALIPAFVYFFQLLYPFASVNDVMTRTAAAAGGTILIRQPVLQRIGGIEAVRDKLIDDVAIAAAVKPIGRIWLGHAALARSIRPYPRVAEIWRMITRTAYVQLSYSPVLLALTTLGMALVWLVPPAMALFGHGLPRVLGIVTWLMLAGSYLPTLGRFRLSAVWAPFLPLVAVFYMAATIGSALNHHLGRGVAWKGRAYGGADG